MKEGRYAAAGVDIDAGNRMVDLIKPLLRKTARAGANAEIGGFGFDAVLASQIVIGLVAILTLLSVAFYLAEWLRHMNSVGAGH